MEALVVPRQVLERHEALATYVAEVTAALLVTLGVGVWHLKGGRGDQQKITIKTIIFGHKIS